MKMLKDDKLSIAISGHLHLKYIYIYIYKSRLDEARNNIGVGS